eukprot:UN04545
MVTHSTLLFLLELSLLILFVQSDVCRLNCPAPAPTSPTEPTLDHRRLHQMSPTKASNPDIHRRRLAVCFASCFEPVSLACKSYNETLQKRILELAYQSYIYSQDREQFVDMFEYEMKEIYAQHYNNCINFEKVYKDKAQFVGANHMQILFTFILINVIRVIFDL